MVEETSLNYMFNLKSQTRKAARATVVAAVAVAYYYLYITDTTVVCCIAYMLLDGRLLLLLQSIAEIRLCYFAGSVPFLFRCLSVPSVHTKSLTDNRRRTTHCHTRTNFRAFTNSAQLSREAPKYQSRCLTHSV